MVRMTNAREAKAQVDNPGRWGGLRGEFLSSGVGVILIKLGNAFLGFITVIVFARFLPPGDYGLYILVLTVAQFLALPLQMGLPILLTREIAVARAQARPALVLGVREWTRRILLVGTLVVGALVISGYAIVVAAGWPILTEFNWLLVLLILGLIPVIAEMKRVMGVLNGYRKPALSRLPDGIIRPMLLLLVGGVGLWADWFADTGLLAVYGFSPSGRAWRLGPDSQGRSIRATIRWTARVRGGGLVEEPLAPDHLRGRRDHQDL